MDMSLASMFLLLIFLLWPNQISSQNTLLQQLLQVLRSDGPTAQAPPMTIDQEILNAAGEDVFNSDISDATRGEYQFQGDIVFKYGDLAGALEPEISVDGGSVRKKRKTAEDTTKRWPGNEVLIAFDSNSAFTPAQRREFQNSLDQWQQKTCVRFRTPTINDVYQGKSFVFVQNGKGCSSPLGMNPMRQTGIFRYQPLTLAPQCRTRRIMMHEIGHSLGLIHEQSRSDRDSHVTVLWNNVPMHMRHNFQKFTEQVTNNRNTPYDYESLMHYGPKAFSTNGEPTLRTMNPTYQDRIGAYTEISQFDAMAINNMYNCRSSMQQVVVPWWNFIGKRKK